MNKFSHRRHIASSAFGGIAPLTLASCLTLLLLIAWPLSAHAAPVLAQLSARLDKTEVIHAEFSQTKTLQALKRPLRTSGRVVFARGQGVLWLIEKPYQASYALGAETVTEIGPDGARRVRAAREVPALAQVGRVFEAIFQGNVRGLEEHFEVKVSGDTEKWRVDLTPKPALERFLKSIAARGGRFLDSIEVEETRGDRTRIEFHDARLDAPLSATEIRLLRND